MTEEMITVPKDLFNRMGMALKIIESSAEDEVDRVYFGTTNDWHMAHNCANEYEDWWFAQELAKNKPDFDESDIDDIQDEYEPMVWPEVKAKMASWPKEKQDTYKQGFIDACKKINTVSSMLAEIKMTDRTLKGFLQRHIRQASAILKYIAYDKETKRFARESK